MAPKLKFCGIRCEQDIEFCNETRPEYIGFIFYKNSPRYIDFKTASKLVLNLSCSIKTVGVFVNEKPEVIIEATNNVPIDIVQLHGDEAVRPQVNRTKVEVWKAVRAQSVERIQNEANFACEKIVLDTATKEGFGGTGKPFNHSIIPMLKLNKPLIIAGGINKDNIRDIMKYNPYCIDISSGIEKDGHKDLELMKQIISIVRD